MTTGLGCGLGCTSALSVTHSADTAAVCGVALYEWVCFFCAQKRVEYASIRERTTARSVTATGGRQFRPRLSSAGTSANTEVPAHFAAFRKLTFLCEQEIDTLESYKNTA